MMEHLLSSTAEYLNKPDADRIKAILVDKWIPYSMAQHVIQYLQFLQDHPSIIGMPNLLLVGDTGNGKSAMLRHYCNSYVPKLRQRSTEGGPQEKWPVVYIQAPAVPDQQQFFELILAEVECSVTLGSRIRLKHKLVGSLLQDLGVRLLIIDEIQHVLASTAAKQREVLNAFKLLTNDIQIPLVFAGIRTAHHVVLHDEQMDRRFDRIELPEWILNDEYLRLLASMEKLLPLRYPSHLTEPQLASKILGLSRGTIGSIVKILKRLAINAILTKRECINAAQIKSLEKMPSSTWVTQGTR
jgi:hypothetical protein